MRFLDLFRQRIHSMESHVRVRVPHAGVPVDLSLRPGRVEGIGLVPEALRNTFRDVEQPYPSEPAEGVVLHKVLGAEARARGDLSAVWRPAQRRRTAV